MCHHKLHQIQMKNQYRHQVNLINQLVRQMDQMDQMGQMEAHQHQYQMLEINSFKHRHLPMRNHCQADGKCDLINSVDDITWIIIHEAREYFGIRIQLSTTHANYTHSFQLLGKTISIATWLGGK